MLLMKISISSWYFDKFTFLNRAAFTKLMTQLNIPLFVASSLHIFVDVNAYVTVYVNCSFKVTCQKATEYSNTSICINLFVHDYIQMWHVRIVFIIKFDKYYYIGFWVLWKTRHLWQFRQCRNILCKFWS